MCPIYGGIYGSYLDVKIVYFHDELDENNHQLLPNPLPNILCIRIVNVSMINLILLTLYLNITKIIYYVTLI